MNEHDEQTNITIDFNLDQHALCHSYEHVSETFIID